MIKHIWSILCQSSTVDSQSNNVSLYNILERLNVNLNPSNPITGQAIKNINLPLQYELINLWTKTQKDGEEKANVLIDFIDPNGKSIKSIEKEVIIPVDKKRLREINKIQGITLTVDGDYSFEVSIKQLGKNKYEKVASLPLEVLINKIPSIPTPPIIKS